MIVLYNPASSANRKPILPMSLLAVGAMLEGRHDYCIVDGNLEADPLEALDTALRSGPDGLPRRLLACTVMPGPQLRQAVSLCQQLRTRFADLIVVWGGYFPTQHWDVILDSGLVDFVVRGHGETTFLSLVEALAGGNGVPDSLSEIHGLAFRLGDGDIVGGNPAPVPHPARLPPWNFERLPMARYVRPTFLGSRTLGYHSSYGCPFYCNFCAVVNMVSGRWLAQPASAVADIAQLYQERWGVNALEFYDNNFFTQEKRVANFCRELLQRDLRLRWWGEGRIDTMLNYHDETWRLMRDAGLHMVFMGAESGSDDTLRRMDKGGTLTASKTLEMVRIMKRWQIVPELSFVMGNPPDPERDARQTMAFIRRVKGISPEAEIIMYLYTPVPLSGTLYEEAKASGFAFPETLDGWLDDEWYAFAQRRSRAVPWLSRPLQAQLTDFERVLNAYYPTTTDRGLTPARRRLLKSVAAWRYHLGFYRFPIELRALSRLLPYQRPETSGF